ncbi:hypothetical protein ACAG26_05200 [Mycobacterium sp. pUA109]|uniref:hypothetical protein n=1 Tax=Mycobacterium sp. pUA109 TaxID=3238982 RepID=UPI00351BA207
MIAVNAAGHPNGEHYFDAAPVRPVWRSFSPVSDEFRARQLGLVYQIARTDPLNERIAGQLAILGIDRHLIDPAAGVTYRMQLLQSAIIKALDRTYGTHSPAFTVKWRPVLADIIAPGVLMAESKALLDDTPVPLESEAEVSRSPAEENDCAGFEVSNGGDQAGVADVDRSGGSVSNQPQSAGARGSVGVSRVRWYLAPLLCFMAVAATLAVTVITDATSYAFLILVPVVVTLVFVRRQYNRRMRTLGIAVIAEAERVKREYPHGYDAYYRAAKLALTSHGVEDLVARLPAK